MEAIAHLSRKKNVIFHNHFISRLPVHHDATPEIGWQQRNFGRCKCGFPLSHTSFGDFQGEKPIMIQNTWMQWGSINLFRGTGVAEIAEAPA